MTRNGKIALTRILSDLILADGIIDQREIVRFEDLCAQYGIKPEHRSEAGLLTLDKATEMLRQEGEEVERLLATLDTLMKADGICHPTEVMLRLALMRSLRRRAHIVSAKTGDVAFDGQTILYIESEYHSRYNAEIKAQYRLCTEGRLWGFRFAYIPKTVEEIERNAQPPGTFLPALLRYIAPALQMERVAEICRSFDTLDTARFRGEILRQKLGLNFRDDAPSLLIKINDSLLTQTHAPVRSVANFLQVPIQGSVVETLDAFIEDFRCGVNPMPMVQAPSPEPHFSYCGFQRTLIELMAFQPNLVVKGEMCIDLVRRTVAFGEGTYLCPLTPQQMAVLLLIAQTSYTEGRQGLRTALSGDYKARMVKAYERIYHRVGGLTQGTDFTHNLKSTVSRLRKQLGAQKAVRGIEDFCPTNVGNFYRLQASADCITVLSAEAEEPLPITEYFNRSRL